MIPHTTLVERWRSQLAENQRLAAEESPRRRWVRRIYVRVLRFLLSRYGSGEWRSDSECEANRGVVPAEADHSAFHAEHGGMDFENHTDGTPGAAPKSVAQIRSVLEAVHTACEDISKSGPLIGTGIGANDWIAVASASSLVSPEKCVRLLRRNGLQACAVRRGDDTIVQVRAGQRDEALTLLQENRNYLRIRSQRVMSPVIIAVVAVLTSLTVVSLLIGKAVVEPGDSQGFKRVALWVFCALGSMIGALVGIWLAGRNSRT